MKTQSALLLCVCSFLSTLFSLVLISLSMTHCADFMLHTTLVSKSLRPSDIVSLLYDSISHSALLGCSTVKQSYNSV